MVDFLIWNQLLLSYEQIEFIIKVCLRYYVARFTDCFYVVLTPCLQQLLSLSGSSQQIKEASARPPKQKEEEGTREGNKSSAQDSPGTKKLPDLLFPPGLINTSVFSSCANFDGSKTNYLYFHGFILWNNVAIVYYCNL
jgi:hypothetical protein